MVVYEIERFIKKANNDDKIGGVFVIDSLCRQHSKEREIFAKRFSIRLRETMSFLQKTSSQDKATLTRLLEEWRKKSVFPPDSLVQILSDYNAAPSSSGALLSPSKVNKYFNFFIVGCGEYISIHLFFTSINYF